MPGESVIAEHPYFGAVTSQRWCLVFHPPNGRSGVEYNARFSQEPTQADYEALARRLPAFQAFCQQIESNDRLAREHFATWPPAAGAFELVEAVMSGSEYPLPWALAPGTYQPGSPEYRPFALRYRARDEFAWDFAGIPWYPPIFAALFSEEGAFSGIDHQVEHAMRGLPETIAPSRWTNGYRHPYFGRCELSELTRIGTAKVARRKIPLDLFMTARRMTGFEPEHLDAFVPIAGRLDEFDGRVRAEFPEGGRTGWLQERFTHGPPVLRRAMAKVFPGAKEADDLTAAAFAAALILDRACFSLSPEGSGGAALTMDYRILPRRVDNELFVAKFTEGGLLLDVVIES